MARALVLVVGVMVAWMPAVAGQGTAPVGKILRLAHQQYLEAHADRDVAALARIDGDLRTVTAVRPFVKASVIRPGYDVLGLEPAVFDVELLHYSGKVLREAHAIDPDSSARPFTLFSTIFPKGEAYVDVPDVAAARAYLREFPEGPFAAEVHLVLADFYDGGRLMGRLGRYTVGLMNIQTGDEAVSGSRPTNFSVVRVKRDVLRKSSIGLIATERSVSIDGNGSNTVYGFDGAFAFFDNLSFDTYWARTRTTGLSGDDTSYRTALTYGGDRYGFELERLAVGEHFNPEVGFVRRFDMRRSSAQARFSPRPQASRLVRRYSWTASIDYTENGAGRPETRDTQGQFGIEFHNSDRFNASVARAYELLPRPFRIAPGIVLPVGGYDSDRLRASFTLGNQRVMSGNAFAEYGTFYSGHRTTVGLTGGRLKITYQLAVEPTYSINKVDLLEGSFTTHLAGSRVTYSMTPLMFASALLQYNSTNHVMSANARLRWEYAPGSELFVVYNEERDTVAPRFPDLANRSFIVKVNRLLRF